MWLGIDDTDSPRGGCTTWVLTEVVRTVGEEGLDLLDPPRLVRLNPNIPWKTRGNAALSVHVGHGRGPPFEVGNLDGRPVVAFPSGRPPTASQAERLVERAWRAVVREAPRTHGTDPALVAVSSRLPARWYWEAVREVVPVHRVQEALRRAGATARVRSGRRGLVGAAAAVAWPARHGTWELIAYRQRERIGRAREVDAASVREAQRAHPELFLCHDPATRRLLVTPHTDCPILFGLRATDRAAPRLALRSIVSEPVDRWMLFWTNQATGDHLVPRPAARIARYRSAVVTGAVSARPRSLAGGHVRFELTDAGGTSLECVAFEPTKTLPALARQLLPGDQLRVWGARGDRGSLQLEGIEVVGPVPDGRWSPPECPACGRTARSLGSGRGWRCRSCRRRFPPETARWVPRPRSVLAGVCHPTPSARRHLAPLAG